MRKVGRTWTPLTEIEQLRLERNQLDAQARKLRAALEAMLDEFGEFAMPSVRRARAALNEQKP